jgi:SEC-C motif-containing protein
MNHLSPSQVILARSRAFSEGDFGRVYDSYHPDSNFCRQFPDRQAYLDYARSVLATDFVIRECRILRKKVEGRAARLILYLDTMFRGQKAASFELALLLRTPGGWRYHSGQKLLRSEFAGKIDEIDWDDFEKAKEKVFF